MDMSDTVSEEVPDSSSSLVVIHWYDISHPTTTGMTSVYMCERAGTVGTYGGLKRWYTSKQTLNSSSYIMKSKGNLWNGKCCVFKARVLSTFLQFHNMPKSQFMK